MKISFIIGTRPELIKVAPVILECKRNNISIDIVNTAQHKDLLDSYWETFDIMPTVVLDVMIAGQNLSSLTSRAILAIQGYIDKVEIKPDIIIAQGDTTTVMAASMVGFYNSIAFAHIEAGLRSFNFAHPYPEEFNRRVASITANIHLCPTEVSKKNLLNEGVNPKSIYVVGNTVIDSVNLIKNSKKFESSEWSNSSLLALKAFNKCVLITCHRRENHGSNLLEIIDSVIKLAQMENDTAFVWTLHPNPNVKQIVLDSLLSNLPNVILTSPLEYLDLLKMINKSICLITDSGGLQEEAPSFKTPVLVLRETTERPEGVDEGVAFLVGHNKKKIIEMFEYVKKSKIQFNGNPYGDGNSAKYILKALKENFEEF